MELLNFGPIIIMLVLSFLIFLLVTRGLQSSKRTPTTKKRPLFFLFYMSILIVSLLVYFIFPGGHGETLEEYEGDFDGASPFYDVMNQDLPIDVLAEFKQSEETYPITGDELSFSESNPAHYFRTMNILIVQDPAFTNEFKVETYQSPYIYKGKNISEFIDPVEVGGNDGVVHLHTPGRDTILNMYDHSFPFIQFLNSPRALDWSNSYQIPSEQMAVIYIPEDVTPNVANIAGGDLYHVELITVE